METVELMTGELAHLRACENALVAVRHAALGDAGDPLHDKWLGPCVERPDAIPDLVADRMTERTALLAEVERLRGALGALVNATERRDETGRLWECCYCLVWDGDHTYVHCPVAAARRALEEDERE